MPISSRAVRNPGKINSSLESENFGSWSRMDAFGDLTHPALDFVVRALRPAEAAPVRTLDQPGTIGRAPDPGGLIGVPTTLLSTAGIAIVAYATDPIGADGDDIIRFVLLSAIGSGTQIFFTDRNWSGTAFAAASAGEGTFTYTAGADLPAGTVVTITSAQLITAGMDLSNNGETVYAYQGTDANTPTSFLYAIDVGDDNNVFEAGELTGTGLTAGTNAVAVGFDQASYAGQSTQIAQTQIASISTSARWHGHSGDDIPGTIYDDRADVTLSGPLTNPDMQLFGVMSGGGQSDAFIRMDNEEAGNVATNLTRLFRDNPNFIHLTDLAFDIEDGVWFAVDNDGTTTTRILKGNIADLVSGTSTPTISVIYDRPNDDDNVPVDDDSFIGGIEIDTVNNQVYFTEGEISSGHNLKRVGYNGGAVSDWGKLDLAVDFIFVGGIYDFTLDVAHNTAYFTYVLVNTINNPPTAGVNYLVKVNSLVNPNPAVENYSIVPINGSNDPDGPGGNPANHFPDVEGSLAGIDIDIANQRIYFVTQRLGANGTAGIFMYDIVTHNYVELWQQQSNNATNSLQPFPTTQMLYIEVDTIGGRYYVSTLNNTDTAIGHDGTATDEGGARIFSGALATTAGQPAPTVFASVFENTANGAVLGMEIDYAPTLTLTGAGSTYTESTNLPASPAGATVDVATSPAVNDADQAIIQGATVAITTGFVSGDQLTFTNSGGITGSYNATTGVVTFTGNATFAQYQTVLDSVRFTNAGDNPTNYGANQSRTVSFTVFDGLLNSDPATATITVVGINDAPVNTPGAAMNFSEDTIGNFGAEGIPPTQVRNAVTGISVFDVDANPATQDITVTLSVGVGTLTIRTDVAGGIQGSDVISGNGTGTIVITATQNQINTTLAALSPAFTGPPAAAATPNGLIYTSPANYNGATNLTITTNDNGFNGNDAGLTGTGGSEQDQDLKVINIADVNDAPTVGGDGTEAMATILEDTPMQQATPTVAPTVASLFAGQFADAVDIQASGGNPTGSPGDTFAGIAIVADGSSPATGQWEYWNGSAWTDIGAASQAAARTFTAATQIRFNPALNYNGAAPTLTVHLIETGGPAITNNGTVNLSPAGTATGGTTVYSAGTVVLSQAITAVNDAPVNTVGGTLTVAEDSGATNVTGMSISDVDANPATDIFSVTLDVLHGTLNLSIVVPGGVTAASGNGTATVTFTGTINQINATLAAAGGVTYTPTGNYNGSDRVQITTDDGGATGLDPGGSPTSEQDIDSKTINVTAVNDPVTTAAPPTLTVAEDATNVAVAGLSISDVDAALAPAGVYEVTLSSTNGTMTLTTLAGLTFSGGSDGTSDATMTFSGTLAAINAALATATYTPTANYNGSATITLSATDTFGGIVATGTGAATNDSDVVNVTVTAVNDPIGTNAPPTATIAEDAVNAAITGLSISDVDATLAPAGVYQVTLSSTAGTLTLTTTAGLTFDIGDGADDATMTFHGTLAAINTALATATYTPPANYNGPATITLSATDIFGGIVATGTGAATNDSDVINVTVTAVNDTPVVSLAATGSSTEQVAGTVDPTAAISDVDLDARNGGNGDYGLATLTIANNAGNDANDLFAIGTSGAFTINGSNLEAPGGLVFATFAGGNGTPLVISFTSSGTAATTALVNAVAKAIQYTYTGDNPPVAGIDIAVSLNDGAPGNAGQGSVAGHPAVGTDIIHLAITDTPENAAPTLDLDDNDDNTVGTGYTASFTEGGAAVLITDSDVAIADVDAGDMIEGATITINGPVAGDLLTLGAQAAPFVVTGSGTGTITITGTGTADQYEAMLAQITFSNTSDDPGATRTINITVTDGMVDSNIAVATINITEINDEPTLSATAVNPIFTEGDAAVDLFSGVTADTIEAGQTFVSLTLTVTNVTDGANEILVVDGVNVALTNANVVATGAGNVTVTLAGSTATVVVGPSTLSEAALQTLIDGLAYLNTSENPTDANRVVTITQLVDSGSDTSPNDATLAPGIASTVNVNPVNDAPLNTVPGTQTINEDASVTLSTGNGNAIQVADADATTLTVTLTVLHGTLTLASSAGLSFGAGDGTADTTMTFSGTAAQINAALGSGLTYNPNANFNGSDSIAVFTTDNGQTGGAAQTDSDSVTVNITAINDAPVVIGDGTESATTINEDTPGAGQTIQALFAGQYSDAADNQIPNGGASSPGQFSGIAVTANGSSASTGQWQYFSGGVWTDIGAASDGAAKLLGDPFVTLIRFNPAPDYNGPAPTLTVHLIDNSLPFGIVNGQVVDLSGPGATGGTTAYSTGTVVLSQDITAVNDGPLNTVPGTQTINEDASVTLSTGNGNAIQVADVDATTVTVTLTVLHGTLTLASSAGLSFGAGDGTADATMTFSGTAAQINAALGSGLTYNPNANFNGSDSISVLTTDNGQTGSGGTLQDNDSITINITAINDAPVVIGDGTETAGFGLVEDSAGPGQTIQALFAGQYSDAADNQIPNGGASSPGQFSGIAVTANGSSASTGQWQYFSGGVWTDIGAASDGAAKLLGDPFVTLIRFNPAPNFFGNAPTLTVHLIDNSLPFGIVNGQVVDLSGPGATGGTTAYSTGTVVLSQTVLPINDAPVNTVPGTQTINEDASVTLSTGNGNAIQVADVDATTLTVTLTVLHGTLTLASSAGLSFGTGDGTADTTMTFSGTAAQINAALGSGLTYNPNANFNGSDSIAVFTTDNGQTGMGPAGTDSDSVAINITAINDAPVVIGDGTETATTINEDSPGAGQTIQALFAGQYSDAADNQIPNGGASSPGQFSGIAVTANGSSASTGQWQYFSGGVWTDIGAASDGAAKLLGDPFVTLIRFNPAANYNGPAPTLTVHLIDNSLPFGIVNGQVVDLSGPGATGGTTAYSTGTVVLSQDVTAVNDAPLNTVPGTQTINEDGTLTFSSGNGNMISVSDVDAGGGTITTTLDIASGALFPLPFGPGGPTVTGAGTNHVVISGTVAQVNGVLNTLIYQPVANANGSFALTISTTDNGNTGSGGALTDNDLITINVNSVNDAPSGADKTLTGSEDDPLVLTAADFGFTDPVEGNAFLAVIIDTFPANGTLFLDSDGPGGAAPVDLSTLGPGVFVSVTDINLGHLYFQPDTDEFGNGYAQFTFRVQDDGGMLNGGVDRDPVANTIFINITPDNLPPVVDLNGAAAGVNYTTTFTEDGAAVAIGSGVIVSDPDSGIGDMIESATITLTDRVAGDSLTLTAALPPGITAVTTPSVGSITIQITGSGTGAQYQALIQSILYATTSQDPTVGGTDLARTITVTVNDGMIDSAVATTTVNITAVDDLATAQPDAFTITESGSIVGGNLFADNGSGADSDPDGPPLAISAVNGSAGNVNTVSPFTLPSGASLQVFSNGTFNYNPNTAFLPTPTAGSGASNTPGHDSFTYTLAGGNTVTVSITLTGLDTDDTLLGTSGTDILVGGNGNDLYFLENSSDQVVEAVGAGYDRIFSSVSYVLGAAAEVEVLSTVDWLATTAINLTGNAFGNVVYGNAGNNTLNGGGGTDVLIGFGGDDNYFVDSTTDAVLENNVPGLDSVFSSVSYALAEGAYVEVLSAIDWTATSAINLSGNSFANIVYGNAGANILNGGGGADILIGFGGDDSYVVDNAGDVVLEYANQGYDTVYVAADYTLTAGSHVEILSTIDWSSTAALNLTGNSLANTIFGNAGANIITGGGGADALYGFAGNDTYYVDSPGAQVFESAGNGNDAVYSLSDFTLGAGQEIEFLSASNFSSTDGIRLTGNELSNTIYGNDGDNRLDGKGGNDSLIGLAGADIFAFTTALGAGNVDLVFGFEHGVDKIALDHTIFGPDIGSVGAFNSDAFNSPAATELNDRIIYNSATGQLFFDADGSGSGVAVQFATLSPGLALTASDFQVI